MYRRVLIPMGIAVWTMVGLALLGFTAAAYQKVALQRITAGQPIHWMLPAFPATGWLVFVSVFFAVRLCSLRGGSRRECIAVGLAPLVVALVPWAVITVGIGLSSLPAVLGVMSTLRDHRLTLGSAIEVREATAQLLGQAGSCLAATWLWFFMSRQGAKLGTGSHV